MYSREESVIIGKLGSSDLRDRKVGVEKALNIRSRQLQERNENPDVIRKFFIPKIIFFYWKKRKGEKQKRLNPLTCALKNKSTG